MFQENEYGKFWFNEKGQRYRDNGPSHEYNDGSKEYWINGEPSRLDGPAIEYKYGMKEWYIKGKRYTEEEYKVAVEFYKRNLV